MQIWTSVVGIWYIQHSQNFESVTVEGLGRHVKKSTLDSNLRHLVQKSILPLDNQVFTTPKLRCAKFWVWNNSSIILYGANGLTACYCSTWQEGLCVSSDAWSIKVKKTTIHAVLNINERTMKFRSIMIVKSLGAVLTKNAHICVATYRIFSR
jgi:hypothetical protein